MISRAFGSFQIRLSCERILEGIGGKKVARNKRMPAL
jgi:hypothetical protein